jgi:YrbI family 3-deoxy-D-manno-octulosonate 8-phosphate phosphatase
VIPDNTSLLLKNIAYLVESGKVPYDLIAWQDIVAGRAISAQEMLQVCRYVQFNPDYLMLRDLSVLDQLNAHNIKLLVLDVDGVMTDGGMIFTKNGDELKKFNSKDGIGINLCHEKGIKVGIISAGHHGAIVEKRATMLGIERFYVGKRPKLDVLKSWLSDMEINPEDVAYIGDDINDIPIMRYIGLSACPADAAMAVKNVVSVRLTSPGGSGCVREFVDNYLMSI